MASWLPALAGPSDACSVKACPAGTEIRTAAQKGDVFFACPSAQLAQYVNFVIGAVSTQVQIGGGMPNISAETGEPEYEGKIGDTMTRLRHEAAVRTFDEAAARCTPGKNGQRMRVLNDGTKDNYGFVLWVMAKDGKTSYWMPASHADRLP